MMYDCKIFDLPWRRVDPAHGQLSAMSSQSEMSTKPWAIHHNFERHQDRLSSRYKAFSPTRNSRAIGLTNFS